MAILGQTWAHWLDYPRWPCWHVRGEPRSVGEERAGRVPVRRDDGRAIHAHAHAHVNIHVHVDSTPAPVCCALTSRMERMISSQLRLGAEQADRESRVQPAMVRVLAFLFAILASAHGFVVQAPLRSAVAPRAASTTMGPAKDGPFTPIVLAAKVVLGEPTLLKLRGKAISIHSQEINKFCAECARPPLAHRIQTQRRAIAPSYHCASTMAMLVRLTLTCLCARMLLCSRRGQEDQPGADQEGEGRRQRPWLPLVGSRD